MTMRLPLLIPFLFSSLVAHAHGEDKPGPNGGYIRMPGGFHTEVVPQGERQVRIYLLDIHWKNPSLKESRVKAQLKNEKPTEGTCTQQKSYYLCSFAKGASLKRGQLIIEAQREGQSGAPVSYELPLRFENSHGMGH